MSLLQIMYFTTFRAVANYVSIVRSCFDKGRWKNEIIQKEPMWIVTHCPKIAVINSMNLGLHLSILGRKAEEANTNVALRHMRSGTGNK